MFVDGSSVAFSLEGGKLKESLTYWSISGGEIKRLHCIYDLKFDTIQIFEDHWDFVFQYPDSLSSFC